MVNSLKSPLGTPCHKVTILRSTFLAVVLHEERLVDRRVLVYLAVFFQLRQVESWSFECRFVCNDGVVLSLPLSCNFIVMLLHHSELLLCRLVKAHDWTLLLHASDTVFLLVVDEFFACLVANYAATFESD